MRSRPGDFVVMDSDAMYFVVDYLSSDIEVCTAISSQQAVTVLSFT